MTHNICAQCLTKITFPWYEVHGGQNFLSKRANQEKESIYCSLVPTNSNIITQKLKKVKLINVCVYFQYSVYVLESTTNVIPLLLGCPFSRTAPSCKPCDTGSIFTLADCIW